MQKFRSLPPPGTFRQACRSSFSLDERTAIQKMITDHASFIEIARTLDKDPTTISKEIRTHLVFVRVGYILNAFQNPAKDSLYRIIDSGLISARNIDFPRKVRFRARKQTVHIKVDKSCRIDRTYTDFQLYKKDHPDTPVTELDSVEGIKGGAVLLTIHFVKAELMLAFRRECNDSQSVIDIFNQLYELLGHDQFTCLFRVCLPDNGREFSNPKAIEFNDQQLRRTRIFYCDPSAPYQKGSAERNHEFIRMFIPKGTDIGLYNQAQINLMMDHINSYCRESIGNRSPYEMFAFLYGQKVLDLLGCHRISPQSVTLNRSIFHKEVPS